MKHLGTATIIYKSITASTGHLYLITNKHCIPTKEQSHNVYFKLRLGSDTSFETIVLPVIDNSGKYDEGVFFAPGNADIVAILFDIVFNTGIINYLEKDFIFSSLLATTDTLNKYQITIGNEVYFMGYPSFFYDKKNISPILRTGVVSTHPDRDFYFNDDIRKYNYQKFKIHLPEKFTGFLIDANVVGGSSGSIVILKPNPYPLQFNGVPIPAITKPYILGILSDSYFDVGSPDEGHTRVNLGGVISSNVILKTLSLFQEKIAHLAQYK